jgi:hypothetical protein
MDYTKVKSIMSIKKNFNLLSFLSKCAPAGLPVIPIGKPVLDFSNTKFKFGTVFD